MTMGHIYNRSPTRSPSRFATSTFETTKIVTSNQHIDKIDKISGVVQRVNVNLKLFSVKIFFYMLIVLLLFLIWIVKV